MKSKCCYLFITFMEIASVVLILFIVVALSSCSTQESKDTVIIKPNDHLFKRWEDVFQYEGLVSFRFDDPDKEIYTFGMMLQNSRGDRFVLDGKADKLLMFDSSGKFLRYISRKGEGPGEYMFMVSFAIDKKGNLYIYDLQKSGLIKFSFPDYVYDSFIRLKGSYQDMVFLPDGSILGYSISDPSVIHKIAANGDILEKHFTPKDLHFRIFSGRFQLGRFSEVPDHGILFSYPAEYKIYLLGFDLEFKKTLTPGVFNKYIPEPSSFPKDMSPYEFSPKHSKWWSKSIRPAMVIYFDNGFFLKEVIQFSNLSGTLYANLHRLDGGLYAIGMEIPFNGRIVYNDKNSIFIAEAASLDRENKIIPLKVHKYRLKNLDTIQR